MPTRRNLLRAAGKPAAAAAALPSPVAPERLPGPTHDELVRRHAFERYERNGRQDGRALDDWLAAEAEVGVAGNGGR